MVNNMQHRGVLSQIATFRVLSALQLQISQMVSPDSQPGSAVSSRLSEQPETSQQGVQEEGEGEETGRWWLSGKRTPLNRPSSSQLRRDSSGGGVSGTQTSSPQHQQQSSPLSRVSTTLRGVGGCLSAECNAAGGGGVKLLMSPQHPPVAGENNNVRRGLWGAKKSRTRDRDA
jgi:hypothetical protein